MTNSGYPRLAQLLEHEGFLRRVAAALVPASEIDDLVQETWVAAATARPGIERPRSWLAAVIRRLAARRYRDRIRRTAREQQVVGSHEPAPSTDEMLARMEAHRELAAAVTALDEPYREAILLRYFEDLPPQEIARRLAVPASTVRTRLERGVARLRGRLERRDLRALVALVLTPRAGELFAAGTGAATTTATQGLLMTAWYYKVGIPVGIAALFVSYLTFRLLGGDDVRPVGNLPVAAAGELASDAGNSTASPERSDQREAVAATSATAAAPARLLCRVVDPHGAAVAGVPVLREDLISGVVFSGGVAGTTAIGALLPAGTSDERGLATVGEASATAPQPFRLWAGEGFTTLATQAPTAPPRDTPGLLVVARATTIEGQVVDEYGLPLLGVQLRLEAPELVDFPTSLEAATRTAMPSARTDVRGRFAIAVPMLEGTMLTFAKPGYVAVHERDPAPPFRHVVLRLQDRDYRLAGKVTNQAGNAVWGATVVVGTARAETNFLGNFDVRAAELAEDSVVLAAMRGQRPVQRADLLQRLRAERVVKDVELVLGGEPLTQDGLVVDSNGKPLAGVVVCTWHPVAIHMFTTPEDLARGTEGELSNLGSGPAKIDARTSDDGTFRVSGLGTGNYRYRVFDPVTLASVTTDEVVAGSAALRIVLDTHARRTIRGMVTMRDGRPAVGVSVAAGLNTWQTATFTARAPGRSTETDDRGHFVLADVVVGDTTIEVSGAQVVGREIPLADFPMEGELSIDLWQRCRFRIAIGDSCQADGFQVQDADGAVLEVRRTRGGVSTAGLHWQLANGRTDILEVSEQAVAIVLLRAGRPIELRPVQLGAESIHEVR